MAWKLAKNKKGFTLVELIIAIGILGLVMTLTVGVLVAVVKSNKKRLVVNEVNRNGDFVMRVLEERTRNSISADCVMWNSGAIQEGTCNANTFRFLKLVTGSGTFYIGTNQPDSTTCSSSSSNKFIFITET